MNSKELRSGFIVVQLLFNTILLYKKKKPRFKEKKKYLNYIFFFPYNNLFGDVSDSFTTKHLFENKQIKNNYFFKRLFTRF